jgi:hypothetical protein
VNKYEHVRQEARKGQPRDHECHAEGCARQVPPAFLMCAPHWRMVPRALQARVWATYQAGQERGDAEVTDEYIEAQQAAVKAVADTEAAKAKPKQARLF